VEFWKRRLIRMKAALLLLLRASQASDKGLGGNYGGKRQPVLMRDRAPHPLDQAHKDQGRAKGAKGALGELKVV
jgi:hypothetical protein